MAKAMTVSDWYYIKSMAKREGVTLKDAGVKRTMTLGRAMDCILAAAGK